MEKRGNLVLVGLLFAFTLAISGVSAYSLNITDDGSNVVVSINNAVNLYSYEVILNYTGSLDLNNIAYSSFLGTQDVDATYGNDLQTGNKIYVYGSRLVANDPGVNGSGELFTIPHVAGNLTLWATTVISSSDITSKSDGGYLAYYPEAVPYCGDNICNNGENCGSCASDCGSCPAVSSSGGGTVTQTQYYSLKIITPGEITISDQNYINVPLSITNTGITDLTGINLKAEATLNGSNTGDITVVLAKSYIPVLAAGQSENFDVRINVNTKSFGRYKLTVFADVTSPKISDWGEFYIELKKVEASDAEQNLIFAERLINKNAECMELNELIKEARSLYDNGDYRGSVVRLKEAVDACTALVSKNENAVIVNKSQSGLFIVMALLTLSLLVLGLILYIYKRSKVSY